MALWRVYRYRSRGRANTGVIRVWEGEARSGPHAIVQAAAGRPPNARFHPLFAREAGDDPYYDKAIVEENP